MRVRLKTNLFVLFFKSSYPEDTRFSPDSNAHGIVDVNNRDTHNKTSMFLFVFILQSPDEQIHHFRKEIDICKKIIIQFSQYRLCTE